MSVSDAIYIWECDICFDSSEEYDDLLPPAGWTKYKGRYLCEDCYADVQREEEDASDDDE